MEIVQWILHNIPSVIAVCVAFGFIITIHELGHFAAARHVGIRCPRFCIGFGPRLFSFNWRGTEFSICLLPLGGYVMMVGEDPENDSEETDFKLVGSYLPESALPGTPEELSAAMEKAAEEKPELVPDEERSAFQNAVGHVRWLPKRVYNTMREVEGNFNDKSVWARMVVVAGGVTMNFISALLLFWIVGLCWGMASLSPRSMPIVMKVIDNSPAAAAGFKYGDHIEAIDGSPVVSGTDMIRMIAAHPAQKITVKVSRGAKEVNLEVTPNLTMSGVVFKAAKNGLEVASTDIVGDDDPTSVLKAGDVITSVGSVKVATLPEMQKALADIAGKASQGDGEVSEVETVFTLASGKTVSMKMLADSFAPEGKIGIMPAQVTEFSFNDSTTNEVTAVTPGSPAEKDKFLAGDRMFLVNGASVRSSVELNEVLGKLSESGEPVIFDLVRNGEHVRLQTSAKCSNAEELGLSFRPITFWVIFTSSFALIGKLIVAPVIIIVQMINNVISPDLVKSSMSGPLGIMQMIFELSNDGIGKLLYVVALINAAVGAFNVIPFPALDGARLLILFIGGIIGKEIPAEKEAWIHQIGLYLLLAMVVLVTYIDIMRLWAGVPLTK